MRMSLLLSALVIFGAGCLGISNTVEVSGLTFDLPSDWEVVSVDGQVAKIAIPDDEFEVTLPLEVKKIDQALVDDLVSGDSNRMIEETASGAELYSEACAPSMGCVYILQDGVGYLAVFQSPTSNEPAPEDLDAPWFPNADVTSEQIDSVFSSVR